MNLALLAPLGLAALAALLVPLLLHLHRQAQDRRTEFAALRWLAARLRPRRRLRVEEPWLLLLRLLLVGCVALQLARPVIEAGERGPPWVLLEPSVDLAQAQRALAQQASLRDAHWRWLAPGFPPIDEPAPRGAWPTASLLRDVDARLPPRSAMTVVVPPLLSGLDGERPRLARPVAWRVLGSAPRDAPTPSASAPARLLVIRGSDGARYLAAAAGAHGWRVDAAPVERAIPQGATSVAWLLPQPVPANLQAWLRAGGTLWLDARSPSPDQATAIVAWRDAEGGAVADERAFGRGRLLQWRQALQPATMPILLEPEFAARFISLASPPVAAPTRGPAEAARPRAGGPAPRPPPRPLDSWLLALAMALLAAERWVATRRHRWRPA